MEWDVSMYGMVVKNMSLHEDLAQIDYIFCDKTGTLTQNELRFRGLCLRNIGIIRSPRSEGTSTEDVDLLVRFICLCHDVTRVKTEKGDFLTGASQDELNLLQMCESEQLGVFVEKDSESFKIEIRGQTEIWQNLKFYEFESNRKMMTRVVQHTETGLVLVLCKGADQSIISRCVVKDQSVEKSVEEFADKGYRTLTFGYRILSNASDLDLLT